MDVNVTSVVALQILAVVAIAGALLVYLMRFKRTRVEIARKAVFITNCDSVTGFESARRFDQLGLRVFAGFARGIDSPRAKELQALVSTKVHLLEFDAANCEKIDRAVEYIHQHLPADEDGLWALVNTTSECIGGLLERLSFDQCERQVHINLVGAIRLTKAFMPLLKRRKGRMVSLVCLGGQPCYPGFAVYASCKAGIESFFEALRFEMQRYDIRFITVSPTMQYQFETRAPTSAASAPGGGFGDQPKLCVLDEATRQAALLDLEDAILSANPLSQYTSAPERSRIRSTAYAYLPNQWKRQKLARDFKSNFMPNESNAAVV